MQLNSFHYFHSPSTSTTYERVSHQSSVIIHTDVQKIDQTGSLSYGLCLESVQKVMVNSYELNILSNFVINIEEELTGALWTIQTVEHTMNVEDKDKKSL